MSVVSVGKNDEIRRVGLLGGDRTSRPRRQWAHRGRSLRVGRQIPLRQLPIFELFGMSA
jgi:hypothetical protein